MVFVHGGGFAGGSGAVGLYRGEQLARRGVVLVTFNYRLGALGWLAHPGLADEEGACANWGLSDQVAALAWVRDNIAAFGGDPGNVTVFGESAGAMSVAALLATDAARPTIRRAILQSGAAAAAGLDAAAGLAEALAGELGLSSISAGALRSVPAERVVDAQRAVVGDYEGIGLPFQPVVDGAMLKRHPAVEIAAGCAAGVDVLVGTNRDEWAFFTFTTAASKAIDEARLGRLVGRHVAFAGLEDLVSTEELIEVVKRARRRRGESLGPADLYTAIATDWAFRLPSLRLAEGHGTAHGRSFSYLFDWEAPFGGGALGSCHALELPFVFGTVKNPIVAAFAGGGPGAEQLSDRMQAAWVAFAASGDPSCEEVGEWPVYEPSRRATMRLGPVVEVVHAPREEERAWLDRALGPYGQAETLTLQQGGGVRASRAEGTGTGTCGTGT